MPLPFCRWPTAQAPNRGYVKAGISFILKTIPPPPPDSTAGGTLIRAVSQHLLDRRGANGAPRRAPGPPPSGKYPQITTDARFCAIPMVLIHMAAPLPPVPDITIIIFRLKRATSAAARLPSESQRTQLARNFQQTILAENPRSAPTFSAVASIMIRGKRRNSEITHRSQPGVK